MILSWLKITISIIYTGIMAFVALLTTPFTIKGNFFHGIAKNWSRGILFICGVRLKVDGATVLKQGQSYVYISNHTSQFDIPVVLAGIPDQIRIIYKKELEKIPVFGWSLKFNKTYISIDRGHGESAMESLESAADKIRSGTSVILFAEGTRSPDGKLQPFKRGPFNLAVRAGVPTVPVTIKGSHAILPKHSLRIRPGTILMTLSEPIEPSGAAGKNAELELRDKVHSVILKNFETQ
jgi:1-acyl-sn-glycerol-3-phosphate acyltransferase